MSEVNDTLESVLIEPKTQATRSLIWLHGLGADGHDFVPIAKELDLADPYSVRLIFPHAPVMPVTINSGYQMRAWYDIESPALHSSVDEVGIKKSMAMVNKLIADEEARGIASENILIAGFSQGAVMALLTGLKSNKKLAGILALSGYLPLVRHLPSPSYKLPIFIGHGQQDLVVPFHLGKEAAEALKKLGYEVDFRQYPVAHSVSLEEIADIRHWLTTRWQQQ